MQAHSMHCVSTLFSQLKKHISFQISNENICIPKAPTCQWEKYLLFEPTKGTSISLMIFFLYNHHSLNENYGCINKKCDNTRKTWISSRHSEDLALEHCQLWPHFWLLHSSARSQLSIVHAICQLVLVLQVATVGMNTILYTIIPINSHNLISLNPFVWFILKFLEKLEWLSKSDQSSFRIWTEHLN